MSSKVNRGFKKLSVQLVLVAVAALLLWGCGGGGDSYTAPLETSTDSPLIDVATLKSWMDDGLVNSGTTGIDNVVILHVGEQDEEKIPGSYFWETGEIRQTRLEGLAEKTSMVSPGETMDAVLQRSGVNNYTTIVVTSDRIYEVTLAYFTLRYWGFPKDRIKVLDGMNQAWDAAYADLTTEVPAAITDNTFTVSNNDELVDDLRYSIGEFIQANDANLDSLAAGGGYEYNILPNGSRFYVAASSMLTVDGAPIPGQAEYYTTDPVSGIWSFKSAEEIQAVIDTYDGFDATKASITHCGSGLSCTPIFFALDGILGLDVGVFDGSSGQWAQYRGCPEDYETTLTDYAANPDFTCPEISDAWNVSLYGRSYDPVDTVAEVTADVNPILNSLYPSPSYPETNQIENQDSDYINQATGTSDSGSAPTPGTEDPSGC